jgi:hypothetical protein
MTAPSVRLVAATSALLDRRLTRRRLLTRLAVVGSAVTTSGLDFVLHPGSAYASICGEANTCGSGWTAMCCTINNGVNRCPPGSFAGGWWKAQGASLCGGKARYYVDCQAECAHCGCHGSHFCQEGCWNCRPHCAHHGTCDERRVCHNVFRYGQCDRERHCSGPVVCRAISCTPPWKWADCSTTAATDNFTVTHSAPCLAKWTPIEQRYTHLGSEASVLGATVHGEIKAHPGHIQRYRHGRMYWSEHTGAHYLTGSVLHHYVTLDQTKSPLGLPTTDIARTRDDHGEGAQFQHGGIYQGPHQGAHALWGDIWKKWLATKVYLGPLGYPTTDLTTGSDGKGHYAHFTHGSIYQGPGQAPHDLYGDIATKYRQLGYEISPLGYPISDPQTVEDADGNAGIEVSFETGAIDMTVGNPAWAVWGPIYTTWAGEGRAAGPLGFPISDVFQADATDQRCDFEHGFAIYNQTTNQVTVTIT